MGVEDIKPGNKRCLSDGDVEVEGVRKKVKTTQVMDLDVSFHDDKNLQRYEEDRTSRTGNEQSDLSCVEKPEDRRLVGRRSKIPVRRPKMRLMPVKEKVYFTGKAKPRMRLMPVKEKVYFTGKAAAADDDDDDDDDDDNKDDDLIVSFEDFDWERLGWEDIDTEEDRLLLRSSAKERYMKLKAERLAKNKGCLIDG